MPQRAAVLQPVRCYPAPNLTRQDIEGYELALSDIWRETIELYRGKIEELEEGVRADEQRRADAEQEKERCVREVQELSLELGELDGIREQLLDELLQLKERIQQEMEGYLETIDVLENEKQSLSAALAQNLKEQQDLMQVKMGLSLEVAAYRALLEGESNQEVYVWTEQNMRKTSPGAGTRMYQYNINHSATRREDVRKPFPVVRNLAVRTKEINVRDPRPKPNLHMTSEIKTMIKNRFSDKDLLNKATVSSATARNAAPYVRSTQTHLGPTGFSASQLVQKNTVQPKSTFNKGEKEIKGTSSSIVSTKESEISIKGSSDAHKDRSVPTTFSEDRKSKMEGSIRLPGEDSANTFKEMRKDEQAANDNKTMKQAETEPYTAKKIPANVPTQPLNLGQVSEDSEIQITLTGLQMDNISPETFSEDRNSNLEGSSTLPGDESLIKSEGVRTDEQAASENQTTVEMKAEEYTACQQIPASVPTQPLNLGPVSEDNEIQLSLTGLQIDNTHPETFSEDTNSKLEGSSTLPGDESVNKFQGMKVDEQAASETQTTVQTKAEENIAREQISASVPAEPFNLGHVSKESEIQITLKGLQMDNIIGLQTENSTDRDTNECPDECSHDVEEKIPVSESNVKSQEALEIHRFMTETPSQDTFKDNITITDILEKVVKPAGLETTFSTSPDAKVTYHIERKENADDGSRKTKITLETTVQEEIDVSDECSLEDLLSKHTQNIALEDIKGTPTESLIENLISLNMQGKEAVGRKAINVQIIEEPLDSPSGDKDEGDFRTPFKIEELECTPLTSEGNVVTEEVLSTSMTADDFGEKIRSKDNTGDTEEVSEADDLSPESKYIVSTPDEYPITQDENESSPYEEAIESVFEHPSEEEVSDSKLTEFPEHYGTIMYKVEYENIDEGASVDTEQTAREKHPSVETIVIEEEVKVPLEVQTSIMGLLKEDIDPEVQLKGTLEQLKGSVSENLKEELFAFTGSGQDDSDNFAMDIKKVEQTSDSGTVTIVAEINVSQNLETDDLGSVKSSDDKLNELTMQLINSEIQKVMESKGLENVRIFSNEDDSEIHASVAETQYMPLKDEKVYSMLVKKSQNGNELPSAEHEVCDLPASESKQQDMNEEHDNRDINRTVRHITFGPNETSFTFQMDVTKVTSESGAKDRTQQPEVLYLHRTTEGTNDNQLQNIYGSGDIAVENEHGQEVHEFHAEYNEESQASDEERVRQAAIAQALQLQRMVDPRSAVSDEEKIAVLYLDEEVKSDQLL